MNRPIMKELSLEPSTGDLEAVAILLDCLEMAKVKTKYAKTGWDAISLHGYGPNPEDILKPGVLKSSVDVDTKLQWTSLKDNEVSYHRGKWIYSSEPCKRPELISL